MFRFQKLEVWKKAVFFANRVYEITNSFPTEEKYGLTSQMRRSSVSVAGNIAEGSGRVSDNDFARFLEIVYGSLMETLSHATVAQHQRFISDTDLNELMDTAEELSRMLSSFRSKLKSS